MTAGSKLPSRARAIGEESARWAVLIVVGFWMTSVLRSGGLIGGGDTVWYHHQIADAVTQARQGVFPVFVGQTQYAFNGAVHPIRTAPLCQYLAIGLDWVTGRSLAFQSLLNLVAAVSVIGGLLTTYLSLVWLAPGHRWRAMALAVIYVSAPGVLGLPYAQDLYMSTTAIPWVPALFAATLQTARFKGLLAPAVLGFSLGALWWAHSPIALWSTLLVLAALSVQALPAVVTADGRTSLLRATLTTAGAFLIVGSYPFVSVLTLRSPGERVVPALFPVSRLLAEVQGAFPGTLLPLKTDAPLLTFMQPGYAVLVALVVAAVVGVSLSVARRRPVLVLIAGALLYLLLILPVPGFTAWIWTHLPSAWVAMTNLWPMQRLAIVIAALAVVCLQAVLPAVVGRSRIWRDAVQWGLIGGVAWSLYQADGVRSLARQRLQPREAVERLALGENVNVSAYCYQQLPHRPAYFIHGVADPGMELRLLTPDSSAELVSNKTAAEQMAAEPWFDLDPKKTANPGLFRLGEPLMLQPGARYLVTFDFVRPSLSGVLRFVGPSMERVYGLPASGDAKGFGTGSGQEKSLVLWTSQDVPEAVQMEFIPAPDALSPGLGRSLGKARFSRIDPAALPIQLDSLLPLAMRVRAPKASLLETVRMAVPGWTAEVNGAPGRVQRSPEGLVAVAVPAGESRVLVRYEGPWLLRLTFWVNGLGWVLMIPSVAFLVWRERCAAPGPDAAEPQA